MLYRPFLQFLGTALAVAVALPTLAFGQVASSVNWRTNLDQAKVEAAQSGRLMLIHFTTKTCGPCRLLDQQVFAQPHVGPAIEQHFVPVRLDADHNVAVAKMFRVDRVPSEYIVSPQGQILANPPIPNQPGQYLEQIQNLANHFRQAAAVQQQQVAVASPDVNSAYAGLPVAAQQQQHAAMAPATAPQVVNNPAAQQPQAPPQMQANPYASTAPDANRYGQAQNVYASQPQQQAQSPALPQASAVAANPPVTQQAAAQQPVMPSNAMPNSYRPSPEPKAGTAAAARALAANPTPQKPELPAGAPPLAFDGYCPVSLKTLNRWTQGNSQYGAVHRGRTYLFAGAEQRDQFLASPDAYSPVFAGLDPVLLLDKQQSVEGTRALGYRYGDAFYLFSSEETKQKFAASPQTYAAGVRAAMNRIDASAGGTVRR